MRAHALRELQGLLENLLHIPWDSRRSGRGRGGSGCLVAQMGYTAGRAAAGSRDGTEH